MRRQLQHEEGQLSRTRRSENDHTTKVEPVILPFFNFKISESRIQVNGTKRNKRGDQQTQVHQSFLSRFSCIFTEMRTTSGGIGVRLGEIVLETRALYCCHDNAAAPIASLAQALSGQTDYCWGDDPQFAR